MRPLRRDLIPLALLFAACGAPTAPMPDAGEQPTMMGAPAAHSSALALTRDGKMLVAANPDADSIAVIDVNSWALVREVLLGGQHPRADGGGSFTPAIMPRSVVLSPDDKKVYATGQRSGRVYQVDVASGAVTPSMVLCSEPVGLVVSPDGESLFVSCSQDDVVLRVAASDLSVKGRAKVASEPWALAWSSDGKTLYATHFLGATVTPIDPTTMTMTATATKTFAVPEIPPRGDRRLAHGLPRGLYDLAARPGRSELWVAHVLLGVDTPQPDLDFESTTFPALSILNDDGAAQQTLSVDVADIAGFDGAFADITSGPHAIAFTRDGKFALVVDSNSEDVLVVDAEQHVEASLLRPLPGHLPEAIALTSDEKHAFVLERNTNDVVVLDVTRANGSLSLAVSGTRVSTVTSDPMPEELRLGQHLFYSANSDEYPITKNHWVACSTCHLEGRSDAVTWLFEQGPRDTPTNAGGMLGTGFLFRTADRVAVEDYYRTIHIEQGGNFDPSLPGMPKLLDAIAAFVNYALPAPIPPTTDAALVTKGAAVFNANGCADCHKGPRFTDSGDGNSLLDLAGTVLLHDVGTCVTKDFPDVDHTDIHGNARAACSFDTPSLTGIASTPPYLHDGSAPTLADVAQRMVENTGHGTLAKEDLDALVEYLRSL